MYVCVHMRVRVRVRVCVHACVDEKERVLHKLLSLLLYAGKTRKFSLFKKTSSKDDLLSGGSGRFERSSGRGKRKTSKGSSSRDSSLDGLSSDVNKN